MFIYVFIHLWTIDLSRQHSGQKILVSYGWGYRHDSVKMLKNVDFIIPAHPCPSHAHKLFHLRKTIATYSIHAVFHGIIGVEPY